MDHHLHGLYPTAGRKRNRRRIARQWPTIEAALRKARDFTVPDGTGGRWFPMALRRLPTERPEAMPAADNLVVLDLAPPPGATTGPSVDLPALDDMGAASGPKWRAYITGRSLIWRPGKTRRPLPRQRGRFGWSADPVDYPVLSMAEAADRKRKVAGNGALPQRVAMLTSSKPDAYLGGSGSCRLAATLSIARRQLDANRPRVIHRRPI